MTDEAKMHDSGDAADGDGDDASCGMLALPNELLWEVIARTSPLDACRLAAVCTTFHSLSSAGAIWDRFLPPDAVDLLAFQSTDPVEFDSKKDLFFLLSDRPVLLRSQNLSFGLERRSGKKCFMLSARALSIVWGDTPLYWKWIRLPDSRFEEVAELVQVTWLEVRGKIASKLLSRRTAYAAYLVFKVTAFGRSFSFQPQETTVQLGGQVSKHAVFLTPDGEEARKYARMFRSFLEWRGVLALPQVQEPSMAALPAASDECTGRSPTRRGDGWLEVEMGEFYNNDGEDGEVEMSMMEVRGNYWKRGLILQGIEIRPR